MVSQNDNAGFTKAEMDQLIRGDSKAFPLQTGELLLIDSLFCSPQPGESNCSATRLLRRAVDDPGGQVCGHALLLTPEETSLLSPSLQTTLFLDRTENPLRVLLLDRNEAFRAVMTVSLEGDYFRVVQARAAAEAINFCKHHVIHLLVADVSSLCPHPLNTRRSIQETQPHIKALLVSGYDETSVDISYPGLLTGVQFFQKPLHVRLLAPILHLMARAPADWQQLNVMEEESSS